MNRACVCVQPTAVSRPYRTTPRDETDRRRRVCSYAHGGKPASRYTTLHYTNTYTVPYRYFATAKVPAWYFPAGCGGGGRA